jgi:hypothetical protein
MRIHHVVGVDPGVVHTGVVSFIIDQANTKVVVAYKVIQGSDPQAVKDWILDPDAEVFIEGYRPRSHFSTDAEMVAQVHDLKHILGGTVLMNTGVKKVVKRPLMDLLGVWTFPVATHHQDLRSAARIALLGMLKSEAMNRVLTDMVMDHLRGKDWNVLTS